MGGDGNLRVGGGECKPSSMQDMLSVMCGEPEAVARWEDGGERERECVCVCVCVCGCGDEGIACALSSGQVDRCASCSR